jgi:hypothetical protein
MPEINSLLAALDERTIARTIGIPHDEARMRYPLHRNTVANFAEFERIIGDYYNHHFTTCVSRGGELSATEATSHAKELLEREYRRGNGDIVSAFNDACDGTNGGLRAVLDKICEALKAQSIERHVRAVFDRYVAPNSWQQKVDIIRQFIDQCGMHLSGSIRADQPERYASDYAQLIRTYVAALRQTSSIFRRL